MWRVKKVDNQTPHDWVGGITEGQICLSSQCSYSRPAPAASLPKCRVKSTEIYSDINWYSSLLSKRLARQMLTITGRGSRVSETPPKWPIWFVIISILWYLPKSKNESVVLFPHLPVPWYHFHYYIATSKYLLYLLIAWIFTVIGQKLRCPNPWSKHQGHHSSQNQNIAVSNTSCAQIPHRHRPISIFATNLILRCCAWASFDWESIIS